MTIKAFKAFRLITILLLYFTNLSYADENGISLERLNKIDTLMNNYIDQDKLAGSVVYIAKDGKPVFHKSFGWRDKETADEMEKSDMFRIASQTKAITSTGIMILQEQGKLLISDPVGKYLPEFMNTTVATKNAEGGYDIVPAKRPITIRDLLTHTAGIGYGYGLAKDKWEEAGIQGWYFADRDEPIRETIRRIAVLPQNAHPGEHFVYGYSTDILGAVIEVISGSTLEEFLSDHILKPLNMTDTHFYVPEEKHNRVANVYSLKTEEIELAANPGQFEDVSHIGQGHYLSGPKTSFSGGAGYVSTAADYAKFLHMIANGGKANDNRILSRKSVELMTRNHTAHIPEFQNRGYGFGLGFQIKTDLGASGIIGSKGEYGWGGAYHSEYWIDPEEKLVIVYLTQLIPSNNLDDGRKLRALIYGAIED